MVTLLPSVYSWFKKHKKLVIEITLLIAGVYVILYLLYFSRANTAYIADKYSSARCIGIGLSVGGPDAPAKCQAVGSIKHGLFWLPKFQPGKVTYTGKLPPGYYPDYTP